MVVPQSNNQMTNAMAALDDFEVIRDEEVWMARAKDGNVALDVVADGSATYVVVTDEVSDLLQPIWQSGHEGIVWLDISPNYNNSAWWAASDTGWRIIQEILEDGSPGWTALERDDDIVARADTVEELTEILFSRLDIYEILEAHGKTEQDFHDDFKERIEKAKQVFVKYREPLKELHQEAGGIESDQILLDTTIKAFSKNLGTMFEQAKAKKQARKSDEHGGSIVGFD